MVIAAIASVMRQNVPGIEVIVVDDGSTDNTCAIVAAQFPEVHIVQVEGAGPGQARNAGVAAASGDVVMFLDSDDVWLDNHVQLLVDTLDRGFQVAYGVASTVDEIGGALFYIPEHGATIEGDCFHALLRWCFLVPSAMAVKRNIFTAIGGFPPLSCGEDWIFFLKLAAQHPFGFTGQPPITLRRLHRGSQCFLEDRGKLLAMIKQVLTVLKDEPRATTAHYRHFTMVHDWTATHKANWLTVQDWYLSMLQEKII